MRFLAFLTIATSLCTGRAATPPQPKSQPQYSLPLPITGNHSAIQDVSLIKRASDNVYFRFSAFDGYQAATAPSLRRPWKNIGPAFPEETSNDPVAHWAPDVQLVNGQYFMYWSRYDKSKEGGNRGTIMVSTSPNLEPASWTHKRRYWNSNWASGIHEDQCESFARPTEQSYAGLRFL